MSKLTRSSFLKTAGLATGAALVSGVPVAGAASEAAPELVVNPTATPHDPLVAYVRDAGKGEVTIVSGLNETTFKDPALVKRLTKAAQHPAHKATPTRKKNKRNAGGVI
jgi:hypothetical protein